MRYQGGTEKKETEELQKSQGIKEILKRGKREAWKRCEINFSENFHKKVKCC